uniref:Retroviral polymerase SH3-like domain-containing protein n=1 Tax=Tanacetum cinerariifolium TaxID=118510 RepID=A0A6L2MH25_TANCI|nr:hypothetical protein [Tanacetum cinerariifolium]
MNKFYEEKDHLGKFDGKSDEGFFVGYSTNSKAFRVYNTRTKKVEVNLHINFLENKPIIAGTNSNDFAGKGASFNADLDGDNKNNDGPCKESEIDNQEGPNAKNNTKDVNTVGPSINITSSNINTASLTVNTIRLSDDFFVADDDMRILDGVEVDISNISTIYPVPTTPNTRFHKDHSLDNVFRDMQSSVQTQRMTVTTNEQGFISAIYDEKTHEDFHTYLFACFLSQEEPKRITIALKDPAWVCVDEIIFGSTKKELCTEFEELMHDNQDKYVDENLRKFKYADVKTASTQWIKKRLSSKIQMVMMLMYISIGEAQHIWLSLILDTKMIKYELSNGLYALTKNSTIYVSRINQFWRTASARTLENGEIVLNATVDGQDKTITKASVRRHLKLADADGISTLPTTKIFEQLALMGYVKDSDNLTFQKDEAITKEMHDGLGRATTTTFSLEAKQGSEDEEACLDKVYSPKQGRMIEEIDEDENVNMDKSVDFSTASPQKDDDEITLAEILVNIKKGATKDNGKAIMQESEPPKKIKNKEMI